MIIKPVKIIYCKLFDIVKYAYNQFLAPHVLGMSKYIFCNFMIIASLSHF